MERDVGHRWIPSRWFLLTVGVELGFNLGMYVSWRLHG